MADRERTTRSRFWLWLIGLIGVIVPRRLRRDWRQEWEAELRYREGLLAHWSKLNWRTKLDLVRRSIGAFRERSGYSTFDSRGRNLSGPALWRANVAQEQRCAPVGCFGWAFDLALPLCAIPLVRGNNTRLRSDTNWWLTVTGRLKPGWSLEQAKAQMQAISPDVFETRLAADYPPASVKDYRESRLIARPCRRRRFPVA